MKTERYFMNQHLMKDSTYTKQHTVNNNGSHDGNEI